MDDVIYGFSSISFFHRLVCVALEMDGKIHVTRCNCPASSGGKCVHIAVLLYFIEDLATNPEGPIINQASTSQPQKWGHGKAVGRNPKALEETDYGKKIKMDLMSDPRPVELRKTSEEEVENFVSSLKPQQNEKIKHPNGPMWLQTLNKNPVMVPSATTEHVIGKIYALEIYDHFILNNSCFFKKVLDQILSQT